MAIEQKDIITTGKSQGIILEGYQGNYTIKGVRWYQKNGEDVTTYEWTFPQTWDKEARVWKPSEKAKPLGLYLGDKGQAARCLMKMLDTLGEVEVRGTEEESDIPF